MSDHVQRVTRQLRLDNLVENMFGKIWDHMDRHDVSFTDATDAVRHALGSEMADQFEEWWRET